MAKVTVGLPQGTRDFGPDVVRKRNYIFDTIRNVFELYGFQPLETPAMENLETLMGKYGEEGDKLIFRILDSGSPFDESFFDSLWNYMEDFGKEVSANERLSGQEETGFWENLTVLEAKNFIVRFASDLKENKTLGKKYLPKLKKELTEKALRYDLTIPFARYVAMNHNKLTFPFKRYQIQPVWRADRPQKGRYREFYQCDADVVGSNSLLNEVELLCIYNDVFEKLGLNDIEIKVNNRKIINGVFEELGVQFKQKEILVHIDKLDKIGVEKVEQELIKEVSEENTVMKLRNTLLLVTGDNNIKLNNLKSTILNSKLGKQGIYELEETLKNLPEKVKNKIRIDPSLARGLEYYTGLIVEIKAPVKIKMGSIGGGGRYDDLTGLFGVPNIPGVGISFGVDRIYDVMEELKLFPEEVHTGTQVLFFNLGEEESKNAFSIMQQLRNKNIRCELYHEPIKLDKQFKYSEKKNIPYVIIIGSKEAEDKTCVIKDIRNGEQQTIPITKLFNFSFL
jgi:histidyl-tRNA synthetase